MTGQEKETAVVVCPGRGTYNKTELGYLSNWHADKTDFIASIDQYRAEKGQEPVSALDSASVFRSSRHGTGDNASPLIYACAVADFQSIDRDRFEIVAVTGNSMGWYLALACAGALAPDEAIHVVNTMGTLMHTDATGGQVVYPLVDEEWRADCGRISDYKHAVQRVSEIAGAEIFLSIRLGGMAIVAGNDTAVKALLKELPPAENRYPFALPHHGAFHTPLMQDISNKALQTLPASLFQTASLPLIDGRGHIWQPHATDLEKIHRYTFDHQITQTYDYSKAIEVAIKEFAPDRLIILGPGSTLGAPTAQMLLRHNWLGLTTKSDFVTSQKGDPFVLSMGIEEQRNLAVNPDTKQTRISDQSTDSST